jgi:hypothetical protein
LCRFALIKKSRFDLARQLPTSRAFSRTGRAITMKLFPPKEPYRNWGEVMVARLTQSYGGSRAAKVSKESGRPRTYEVVEPLPD